MANQGRVETSRHRSPLPGLIWKEVLAITRDRSQWSWSFIVPIVLYVAFYITAHTDGGGGRPLSPSGLPFAAIALSFIVLYETALQALLLGGERIVTERQQGTLYTLLASPARRLHIALAPAIASVAFVLPALALVVTAVFATGWGREFISLVFIVVSAAIALHCAALGTFLGATSLSSGHLRQKAILLWLLVISLSLAGDSLPVGVDAILRVIPLYWGVRAMNETLAGAMGGWWPLTVMYLLGTAMLALRAATATMLPRTIVS